MELKEVELTCRKVERTEQLIAKFVDGYASGWEFAVKKVFKESLDIRETTKTINKKEFKILTQGNLYNFQLGDTFSNHKLAYGDGDKWLEFLQDKNPITIQVQFGGSSGFKTKSLKSTITTPLEIKNNSKTEIIKSLKIMEQVFDKGNLRISIYKPNEEKNRLVEDKIIEINIVDFISLLQNGTLYDNDLSRYISYKYEG